MRVARAGVAVLLALPALAGCLQVGDAGSSGDPVPAPAAFLRSEPYPDLVVEVDHVAGFAPDPRALSAFEGSLRDVTDKRSIAVTTGGSIEPQAGQLDAADLRATHRSTLDRPIDRSTAVLHILYVDGAIDGAEELLGASMVRGRSAQIFVFGEQLDATARPALGPSGVMLAADEIQVRLEAYTLVHELGHVLGLVDNGVPMASDHEDPQRPGHSSNPQSVMYHAAGLDRVLEGAPGDGGVLTHGFDAADLEDLRRVRDGEVEPTHPTIRAGWP